MKQKELLDLSVNIIKDHYLNNDVKLFLKYLNESVIFLGPGNNQTVIGKNNVLDIFKNNISNLKFEINDINGFEYHVSDACAIVITYNLIDIYSNGTRLEKHQRAQFSWIKKDNEWSIVICHVSDEEKYSPKDNLYPNDLLYYNNEYKIIIKDNKNIRHYIDENKIIYIESNNSIYSILHTIDGDIESKNSVREISNQSKLLVRCHASFLINPYFVKKIERFNLTTKTNILIPIPEKKYTKIKKILLPYIKK